MKFIIINDPHFSARAPASRKSNYLQCILRKLTEVVEYANKNKIDGIVSTGDWFISKKPESTPYWMLSKIYDTLSKFKGHWYSVIGNHDSEISLESFDHSPLYLLLTLLEATFNPRSLMVEIVPGIFFSLVNFDRGGSVESIRKVAESFPEGAQLKVMFVHGPIMSNRQIGQYPQQFVDIAVRAEQLTGIADFIFYGDIHDYHGVYEIGDTTFCNLGSIARNTAKELNRYRPVLMALFDTDTREIEQIELEDVELAEDVFRVEELRYDKQVSEEIEAFVESLDQQSLAFTILTSDVLRDRIKAAKELSEMEKKIGLAAIDNVG